MTNETSGTPHEKRLSRRRAVITLCTGAGVIAGVGAISGTAAAWRRNDVQFNDCREVVMIVSLADINRSPPTVANVIVETADGDLECRTQEFTPETVTMRQYRQDDAPILTYAVDDDEKILGVILYNYTEDEDRFVRESPLRLNPNRCANTPETPDAADADCANNAYVESDDILSEDERVDTTEDRDSNETTGQNGNTNEHQDGSGTSGGTGNGSSNNAENDTRDDSRDSSESGNEDDSRLDSESANDDDGTHRSESGLFTLLMRIISRFIRAITRLMGGN